MPNSVRESRKSPRSRSEQDVFLSYTGGTTGLPKGVRYTIGRGVLNALRLRERFRDSGTELGIVDYAAQQAREGTRMIAIPASPLMHSTGFTFASLPTLTSGGQVTTLEGRSFDAHELLATVGAVRADHLEPGGGLEVGGEGRLAPPHPPEAVCHPFGGAADVEQGGLR